MGQLLSRVPAPPRPGPALRRTRSADPVFAGRSLRDAAWEHGHQRNVLFEQSRAAWHSGDRALAKSLSTQGKAEDAAMKLCNQQAAAALLKANNEDRGRSLHELDLHGLHVEEAILAVQVSCNPSPLVRTHTHTPHLSPCGWTRSEPQTDGRGQTFYEPMAKLASWHEPGPG